VFASIPPSLDVRNFMAQSLVRKAYSMTLKVTRYLSRLITCAVTWIKSLNQTEICVPCQRVRVALDLKRHARNYCTNLSTRCTPNNATTGARMPRNAEAPPTRARSRSDRGASRPIDHAIITGTALRRESKDVMPT